MASSRSSIRRTSIAIISDGLSLLSTMSPPNQDQEEPPSNDLRAEVDHAVEKVVSTINKEKEKLEKNYLTPALIRTRDKITFVVSLLSLIAVGILLGHSPHQYYQVNAVIITTTVGIRFLRYRLKRWHWYLLDFCYMVNFLVIAWCFSPTVRNLPLPLFRVLYAFSHGVLAISIILFRNSFVLHSLDRTTSVLIHFSPCLCTYILRWYTWFDNGTHPNFVTAIETEISTHSTIFAIIILQFSLWFLWAISYYLKVFVFDRKKAIAKNYETLFIMVKNTKGSPLTDWIKRGKGNQLFNPYVRYMSLHCALMLLSTAVSALWWNYFWLNTMYVLFIVVGAFWNGAGFYFVWFSKKYEKSVALKYGVKTPTVKKEK